MAEEKKTEEQPAGGKSSRKPIIIIASVVAVLAIGGGTGAYFMLAGKHKGEKEAAAESHGGEGEQAEGHGEGEGGEYAEVAYLSLAPAFVVNFQPGPAGEKPKAKFLSVEIDAVVADAAAVEPIKEHMPAVRNSVIMLLSRQTYDELIKPEGKEKLRGEVLDEIRKILKKTLGKEGIREVYFTSFVMQ